MRGAWCRGDLDDVKNAENKGFSDDHGGCVRGKVRERHVDGRGAMLVKNDLEARVRGVGDANGVVTQDTRHGAGGWQAEAGVMFDLFDVT